MFFARLLSFCLGLVFAWAAAAKGLRPGEWRRALAGYRPPGRVARPLAFGIPVVECGVALSFFAGATRLAASGVLFLTAVFSLAILRARALQGARLPCGCFGGSKQRDVRVLLARNTVLAAAAAALLVYDRDVRGYPAAPTGDGWLAATLAIVGAALLVWLVAAVRSGLRKGTA